MDTVTMNMTFDASTYNRAVEQKNHAREDLLAEIREYVQEFVTRSAEGGDMRTDTICKTPDETRDFFNNIFAEESGKSRSQENELR
ncbi:hypothetical protein [Bifidobacterium sp. ESL0745]|uniref:hypothetical protein n=1 Tax=Bifidobacterium sp. ESL0745 TaxID=2983226 RepID=UPI0023F66E30|nr:hypothetical protein [Bifidobacterium sp. ESL0745]MDF7666010.1 hypothetical protein [Bifidobacterium sp. ESL0745]